MIVNLLKTAWRSMVRQRAYSAINMAGLSVSVAAALLITLWVMDERSYDRFQEKGERIYRATWHARYGDNEWNIPLVPVPLAPTLKREFPEVEQTAQIYAGGLSLRRGDEFVREQSFLFVEPSFFDVFTVRTIAGDAKHSLERPDGIVITEEIAKKYFADAVAVGKTLETNDGRLLHVGAVVQSFPPQSHMHFRVLAPLGMISTVDQRKEQWGSATLYTYVLLKDAGLLQSLNEKLDSYVRTNVAGTLDPDNFTTFPLTPLFDLHLHSHLRYEMEPGGDIQYVVIFSIVAGFIVMLACINFVNLSTARSIRRAREVGLRKTIGSTRSMLIEQFMLESFVQVAIAVIVAMLLAEMIAPSFSDLTGKTLSIAAAASVEHMLMWALFVLLLTLAAGVYPALVLSSFRPGVTLQGESTAPFRKTIQKGLVIVQFVVSVGLMIGTVVVDRQLSFIREKKLGFEAEYVLVLHRASALGSRQSAFRSQLMAQAAIVDVSAVAYVPGQDFDSTMFEFEQPAAFLRSSVTYDVVDPHFVDALKLTMIRGRNFSTDHPSDSSAFVINRAAASMLGWEDPVGRTISMGKWYEGPVIGVVEDFHFESLHHAVKPMLLMYARRAASNLVVRLRGGDVEQGLETVRSVWSEFVPNVPLDVSFLDEDYQQLYVAEQRAAIVLERFSLLAIGIACLGLFGLAAYAAERRTKEIGIRRVLGATIPGVILLVAKDFLLLVAVSIVIAIPAAYVAAQSWLEAFAFRIDLEWWMFAVAGLTAIVVAFLTVGVQALRAGRKDPVESLRYE